MVNISDIAGVIVIDNYNYKDKNLIELLEVRRNVIKPCLSSIYDFKNREKLVRDIPFGVLVHPLITKTVIYTPTVFRPTRINVGVAILLLN